MEDSRFRSITPIIRTNIEKLFYTTFMNQEKIREFTDLRVWQAAHQLVISIYKLTKLFPKSEIFGLISQMQRSAVSITSNIAEGFGRQTYKEKIQFYYQAQGSLTELKNQVILSRDISYITQKDFESIMGHAVSTHRLLQAFITKSKEILRSRLKTPS